MTLRRCNECCIGWGSLSFYHAALKEAGVCKHSRSASVCLRCAARRTQRPSLDARTQSRDMVQSVAPSSGESQSFRATALQLQWVNVVRKGGGLASRLIALSAVILR